MLQLDIGCTHINRWSFRWVKLRLVYSPPYLWHHRRTKCGCLWWWSFVMFLHCSERPDRCGYWCHSPALRPDL